MSSFDTSLMWPPKGWNQFADVKSAFSQSLAKDAARARIFGLQYKIETVPLFKGETRFLRHNVMIDGWEYSILNESTEYPILSFSLMDRLDNGLPLECFISDIRSYSTPIPHTRRSANRAVSASLFLINQIAAGHVPDVNRVLRVYKLHPAQAFLYQKDKPVWPNLQKAFDDSLVKTACCGQA
jgi:hypothetical protein